MIWNSKPILSTHKRLNIFCIPPTYWPSSQSTQILTLNFLPSTVLLRLHHHLYWKAVPKSPTKCNVYLLNYIITLLCHQSVSKAFRFPHLRFLAGCGLQRHGRGHHGVTNFPQRWRRLPLGGACGNMPVVCAWRIAYPHPPRRQVRVRLKCTGVPERL